MSNSIALGTQVRVSDGSPKPPARFTKKVGAWEEKNYDAVVVKNEGDGFHVLQIGDYLNARQAKVIIMTRSSVHASKFNPIEGAALLPVKSDVESIDYGVLPIKDGRVDLESLRK